MKNRIKKRKKAKDKIEQLYQNVNSCLIIHYSCENLYNIKEGKTPRITSIAVRFMDSGETKSFSIHKIAERNEVEFDEIEKNYNLLEKEMLDDFYKFLNDYKTHTFIHWKMRDINYGFEAINHRYETLQGKPIELIRQNKVDLSKLIKDIFGDNYAKHPRLENLMRKNQVSYDQFLKGAKEAEAFDNKEYTKFHQSTLIKTHILEKLFERVAEGRLKTESTIKDIYGLSPQGFFELAKDNWIAWVISTLIVILIGTGIRLFFLS